MGQKNETAIPDHSKVIEQIDSINFRVGDSNRIAPEEGLKEVAKAMILAKEIEYESGIAHSHLNLAACSTWLADHEHGIKNGLEAVRMFTALGDTEMYAWSLITLGNTYYYISDFDISLDYFLKARKLFKRMSNDKGVADALNGIGNVYKATEQHREAIGFYKKALKLAVANNDDHAIARISDGLGEANCEMDDVDSGIENFELSARLAAEVGDGRVQGIAVQGLGDSFLRKKDFPKTREYYSLALEIRETINDKIGVVHSLMAFGRLETKEKNYSEAIEHLTNALNTSITINVKEAECNSHLLLSLVYEQLGMTELFKAHYKEYFTVKEKVYSQEILYKSKARELQFEIEKREKEKELEVSNQNIAELSYNIKQLSDVGKAVTSRLSVPAIVKETGKQIKDIIPFTGIGIGVYDAPSETISYDNFDFNGNILKRFTEETTEKNLLSVWCLDNLKEVFIPDLLEEFLSNHFMLSEPLDATKLKSLIYMPIVYQENRIGVICVLSDQPNNFNVYHLDILRNLSVYLGIAISNALVYRSLEDQVAERTKEVVQQKEFVEKSYQDTVLLGEIAKDVTASLSVREIVEKVYVNVSKIMPVESFGIGVLNEQKTALDFDGYHEFDDILPFHSDSLFEECMSSYCFNNREEIVIGDFDREVHKYFSKKYVVTAGEKMESLIYLPLIRKDEIIGVITVQCLKKGVYEKQDLSILRNLAVFIVIALENARAYETIEKAKVDLEKLSIVAEETQNGVLIADADGEIEWSNKAFSELTGMNLSEFKEAYNHNITELSGDPQRNKLIQAAIKNKEPFVYEGESVHKDGRKLWLQITLNSIYNDDGVLSKIITVSSDITERKAAETRTQELAERLHIVNSIDRAILTSETGEAVVSNALNKLKSAMNLFGVSIALFDFRSETFRAHVVRDNKAGAGIGIEDDTEYPLSDFGSLPVLRKHEHFIEPDIAAKDSPSASDLKLLESGAVSYLCVPLIAKGDLIGSLNIQADVAHSIGEQQVLIMQEVANSLAVAIYQNKLQDIIRENYQDLNDKTQKLSQSYRNITTLGEIGQKITGTLDLSEIAKTLYDNINTMMPVGVFSLLGFNAKSSQLDYIFYIEEGEELERESISLDNPDSLSVWTIRNAQDVVMNNFDEEIKGFPVKGRNMRRSQSLILIPLFVEERPVGVFGIQTTEAEMYSARDIQMLKSLSAYISIALDNAKVYADLGETNKVIEQKSQDITDSIQYALRIQQTILPTDEEVDRIVGDKNFVLYKPRDIVSGDWYWAHDLGDGKSLFTVGDCTGHGVPGAFMSLISHRLLAECVIGRELRDPGEILNQMRKGIMKSLKQEGREGDSNDGLDMAMCILDRKNMQIHYAGANCPLYLLRDGEMTITKPTKQPIGFLKKDRHKDFESHIFDLQKGDRIYVFSDGYADQFGGPDERKFKYSNFNALLVECKNVEMKLQMAILDKAFNDWKRDLYQVDDVCVMGVEI